jgi:hypothetical protein
MHTIINRNKSGEITHAMIHLRRIQTAFQVDTTNKKIQDVDIIHVLYNSIRHPTYYRKNRNCFEIKAPG